MKRFGLCLLASLALASCGDDAAPVEQGDEDATARGEVLGGTISDDMLPLDTVRSQAPSLAIEGEGEEAGTGASDAEGEQTDPAPAGEDAGDPQPEPAPEAEAAAEPSE